MARGDEKPDLRAGGSTRAQNYLQSKYVPYVRMSTPTEAKKYLPEGPNSVLTSELVRQFSKASRRHPEIRLAVFGTLRAHSANGPDAPLAAAAVLFAALGIYVALAFSAQTPWGWLIASALGIVLIVTALRIIKLALAAHARRVVAVTWLGAYEDATRDR